MALRLFTVNRWAVTGTPIGRYGVADLYGLCLFVQQFPLARASVFHQFANEAVQFGPAGWHDSALFHLLREFVWRSTRQQVADELVLPPQSSETIQVAMTAIESYNYSRFVCGPPRPSHASLGLTVRPFTAAASGGGARLHDDCITLLNNNREALLGPAPPTTARHGMPLAGLVESAIRRLRQTW